MHFLFFQSDRVDRSHAGQEDPGKQGQREEGNLEEQLTRLHGCLHFTIICVSLFAGLKAFPIVVA